MNKQVLTTEMIRSIASVGTQDGVQVTIRFGSSGNRDAFVRWLKGLQKDAAQSPAERYEVVRQQMDSSNPSVSE